jgi:dihydropteroate synthase
MQIYLNYALKIQIMGILNVTPDSFSDDGQYNNIEKAIQQAFMMQQCGADCIDIGGESTRPNSIPISEEEEIKRVLPILQALKDKITVPLSIDTYKPNVAKVALENGVKIVNDIWGLQHDTTMAKIIADHDTHCILMHNRHEIDASVDIIDDILSYWDKSLNIALKHNIATDLITFDPGIGFKKTPQQNIIILQNIDKLKKFGFPLLIGASLKSFIGHFLEENNIKDRIYGTLAVHFWAAINSVAMLRVHDVKAHKDVLNMLNLMIKKDING